MKQKFNVEGMTCSSCQSHVQHAVEKTEGVTSVFVNLLTNSMVVEWDEEKTNAQLIEQSVSKAGYKAYLPQEKTTPKQTETTHDGRNLLIAGIFALLVFYLSMGPMIHIPLPPFFVGEENALLLILTEFFLTLPVLYIYRKYFIVGFKRMFRLSFNMDTLIALGASASMIYGIYVIFAIAYHLGQGQPDLIHSYAHDVYFESASTILVLVSFGKYLEGKSKKKTNAAIEKLMDLSPKKALLYKDGKEIEIPIEQVQLKDHIIVKKGMSVAVDGKVIEGNGSLDQSNLTGESIPVYKEVGDSVISATILLSGYLVIEAEKVGEDTTIQTIIKLVEEAGNSKAPISKLADRISRFFVPTVMLISLISFIVFLALGYSFEFAFGIGISVLVIACPCALGLATPVAIMVGTGVAARNGLLIKNAEILEKTHLVKTIVLDKTGTITEGKPVVTDILCLESENILQLAVSLEQKSEHPLATAILAKGQEENIEVLETENFESHSGLGISAKINGTSYSIGNEKYISGLHISLEKYEKTLNQLKKESKTPLLLADREKLIGIIAVKDEVKKDSKKALEYLKQEKIQLVMLTGDNEQTAKAIAEEIGIDRVYANVLPNEKQNVIRQIRQDTHSVVAMVGDGVNDAPALMEADIGIAIGAGSDIAIEAADIVLISNSLTDVYNAVRLSKRTIHNIQGNLFWAFFYNCIGILLASGVFYAGFHLKLNPMISAAAMSLSSVFVVTNALSLNLFQSKGKEEKKMSKVITLEVLGMSCKHCAARVEQALTNVSGVQKAEVNLKKNSAKVQCDESTSKESLVEAVKNAGYEAK